MVGRACPSTPSKTVAVGTHLQDIGVYRLVDFGPADPGRATLQAAQDKPRAELVLDPAPQLFPMPGKNFPFPATARSVIAIEQG